jgi:ketosteroid isomerase-like protein
MRRTVSVMSAPSRSVSSLLRHAVVGEEEWGEWIWRGTKEDGTPLEERGVTIMGIRDGQIAWGRLYLAPPGL